MRMAESQTLQLILWRHADAEDLAHAAEGKRTFAHDADSARALTSKGRSQARSMAKWLRARLPEDARVLTSPARRAVETASALTKHYQEVAEIGTRHGAADLLSAIGWPDLAGTVVVVGHQPTLGRVAALLVSGRASDWSVKKGAVWWLARKSGAGDAEIVVRAVIAPEFT